MAHYLIISGIPDSILMLIMHLETPHETFAYLENRYGRIPRPETCKVVDKAIQQHDMPYEQCEAENGNNEPVNSRGREDDSLDIPSDSAETTDGHMKPEVEVVDARQAGDDLQVVVDRATDLEWPAECASTLEAPDKGSQCADNKAGEDKDLPTSSDTLKTPRDLPFTTSECAETRTGHQKPENEVVDTWHVVDVLPMFEVGSTGQA
ncbi:hypothetical protein EDD16DRAFT_1733837 [Pisolithus croceorrhizus]|nr:hypothetical protein EDD16DRAFT_1733837 [Pisolithus croceorrhizus]KAI6095089.1 hypothetical protein EV401DRAFT_2083914 [Pisolithus croceorrhizus]KAI6154513.1 hypothetical protein EDD17DRAFT_1764798 [Pisolithus thermaeus]